MENLLYQLPIYVSKIFLKYVSIVENCKGKDRKMCMHALTCMYCDPKQSET